MLIRKAELSNGKDPKAAPFIAGQLGPLQALVEFLAAVQWEDGSKRRTGTVMLLAEDGKWKAWIHDRDGKASAWLTASRWEDLLESISRALEDGSLEWRRDR